MTCKEFRQWNTPPFEQEGLVPVPEPFPGACGNCGKHSTAHEHRVADFSDWFLSFHTKSANDIRSELGVGTFQSTFRPIFDQAFDTLVAKQRSYGPKNIEELGFYGVFSRLASDKIERLRNGLNGTVKNGRVEVDFTESLDDETLEDTLVDVMNYAAILICLKRGQWGAPLE